MLNLWDFGAFLCFVAACAFARLAYLEMHNADRPGANRNKNVLFFFLYAILFVISLILLWLCLVAS